MDIYALSDMIICQKIGEKLKSTRLRQNITQAQLASDAQISISSVKKIESGQIASFDSLMRMLRVLGRLDVLQPLVDEEQMSPNEYYEFINSQKKKIRQRATGTTKNNPTNTDEEDIEW